MQHEMEHVILEAFDMKEGDDTSNSFCGDSIEGFGNVLKPD